MTVRSVAQRSSMVTSAPLVIAKANGGFRVYAASDPSSIHWVTGGPDEFTCTCPDFRAHHGNGSEACAHIQAVRTHANPTPPGLHQADPEEREERLAIQQEGQRPDDEQAGQKAGPAQMILKRSVSPDGRIDALSVEFAWAVEQTSVRAIKAQALKTLKLQAEIVASFLAAKPANGSNGNGKVESTGPDGAIPAELLQISGMDGKWGRRLFITVQANGHTMRLFGNRKQLADAIVAAGFPDRAEAIAEGVALHLPCRVVTTPTADGRYLNVTQCHAGTAGGTDATRKKR